MAITVRELTPDDWDNITNLFGARGGCGGCWCMYWRIPHGGKMWREAVGEPNKQALRRLVTSGEAKGLLAFDDDTPVGWCSFGKRTEFPRTETVKAYGRDDADKVWSINCFFVLKDYRRSGISELLLDAALKAIKKRRGKIVEAYPAPNTKDGKQLPAAWAYTGPEVIFQRLGFELVQRVSYSRPLYRYMLNK